MLLNTINKEKLRKDFINKGFKILESVVDSNELNELTNFWANVSSDRKAGVRNLLGTDNLFSKIARTGNLLETAAAALGKNAFPVRIILFDKSPEANWGVAWHQDTSIAVKGEAWPDGYGPRSVKQGVPHVIPPRSVLESMATIRLALDNNTLDNGPLLVIPRSHQQNFNAETIAETFEERQQMCTMNAGDALIISPLLYHSSRKATSDARRRILHIEYASTELPSRLNWYFRD
jgi:hypothetical protein